MTIAFKRLSEVDKADLVELMNHPLVRRQMPLTSDNFTESAAQNFVEGKERCGLSTAMDPGDFSWTDRSLAGAACSLRRATPIWAWSCTAP